jgi:oligopeptide transport system substrate-binding protein
MWKKELGIEIEIANQEWKVHLAAQNNLDYQVSRAGFVADYADPNSFFDIMRTRSGNNNTGFASPEYERLLAESLSAPTPAARVKLLQQAEEVLMRELPVIPLYFYTRNYLLQPSVKGWSPNLIDNHPWKYVHLDESAVPDKLPTLGTIQ